MLRRHPARRRRVDGAGPARVCPTTAPRPSGRVRRERRSAVTSKRRPRLARRGAAGLGPFTPITDSRDRTSSVGAAELSDAGEAIVLKVRRHRPTQRIRATIVAPDGTRAARAARSPTRRTRPPGRSSRSPPTAPRSPPGRGTTARAGARRRRSGARGSRASIVPQNVSPPISNLSRWLWIDVAAGVGGHAALTWFYGGAGRPARRSRRCGSAAPARTAASPPTRRCRAGAASTTSGSRSGRSGAVQLAYSEQRLPAAPSRRRPCAASSGTAGEPLPGARACSRAAGRE